MIRILTALRLALNIVETVKDWRATRRSIIEQRHYEREIERLERKREAAEAKHRFYLLEYQEQYPERTCDDN